MLLWMKFILMVMSLMSWSTCQTSWDMITTTLNSLKLESREPETGVLLTMLTQEVSISIARIRRPDLKPTSKSASKGYPRTN